MSMQSVQRPTCGWSLTLVRVQYLLYQHLRVFHHLWLISSLSLVDRDGVRGGD